MLMRWIGLALVIAGTAVAAIAAARPPAGLIEEGRVIRRVDLLGEAAKAARDEYCAALAEAGLSAPDACPPPDAPTGQRPEGEPPPTPAEQLAADRDRIARLRQVPPAGPAPLQTKREAWLTAEATSIEARGEAVTVQTLQPSERLTSWLGLAGLPYAAGLVLIVLGALLSRRAQAAASRGDAGPSRKGAAPLDFGVALREITETVAAMAAEAEAQAAPTQADFDALKARLDALTLSHIEPVVEARDRLKARYGVAGFAAVFGPLSAGERNVNRAWSALVDQHWPEATASLGTAAAYFGEARRELDELISAKPT